MKRRIPEVITEAELLLIIKSCKSKNHKLAFILGFYECMRVSEVVNLKLEHIDKNSRQIMIKQGKGGKDRNIPINPFVLPKLKHLPIGCGIRALQIAFKDKGKEVTGRDVHFHTLRHSGATYYLNQKKWNLRKLQRFLGHSKVSTTEIYTHVNEQDLVDEMWKDDEVAKGW